MRIVCAYGSPVNSRAPVPMSLLRTLRRGTSGACTSRHATEDPGRRNVLAKVEQGVIQESVLRSWLEGPLTRRDDRALFGLKAR
jgi:hypothetical protein